MHYLSIFNVNEYILGDADTYRRSHCSGNLGS